MPTTEGFISIHAPREGSDPKKAQPAASENISIHAPREGSDGCNLYLFRTHIEFLSTLPARGATRKTGGYIAGQKISIHAPREGSDGELVYDIWECSISIHAPREGSDYTAYGEKPPTIPFLSTLPARGATRLKEVITWTST